jgi:hypothetical protein
VPILEVFLNYQCLGQSLDLRPINENLLGSGTGFFSFFLSLFLAVLGDWTQGLTLTRQVLSHSATPFLCWVFLKYTKFQKVFVWAASRAGVKSPGFYPASRPRNQQWRLESWWSARKPFLGALVFKEHPVPGTSGLWHGLMVGERKQKSPD